MLSAKDVEVLACLRRNARETLTRIARVTGVPISTVFDKVQGFVASGVVKKFTAVLEYASVGFATVVLALVKVKKEDREAFQEFVVRSRKVNSVWRVNNGFDFVVECLFCDLKDAEGFFEGLDEQFKVEKRLVLYEIERVKQEEFLTSPECARWLGAGGEEQGVSVRLRT